MGGTNNYDHVVVVANKWNHVIIQRLCLASYLSCSAKQARIRIEIIDLMPRNDLRGEYCLSSPTQLRKLLGLYQQRNLLGLPYGVMMNPSYPYQPTSTSVEVLTFARLISILFLLYLS